MSLPPNKRVCVEGSSSTPVVPSTLPTTPPRSNIGRFSNLSPVKDKLPESPQAVKSPMKYHYFEEVVEEKRKQLKKLENRPVQSVAPRSTEKQFKVIQRNYSELRQSQRNLLGQLDEQSVEVYKTGDARVIIKRDEFIVHCDGKQRAFGIHYTTLASGARQCRAYPKDGDGVVNLSGQDLVKLVEQYKSSLQNVPFKEFVIEQVKNTSMQPAVNADASADPEETQSIEGSIGDALDPLLEVSSALLPEDPANIH